MSQYLIAGANAPIPTDTITVRISSDHPIDCAAYRLASSGKVRGDGDMVFYGQTQSDDGHVVFRGHDTDGFFDIQLIQQPSEIEKIALAFSSDKTLAQVGNVSVQVIQNNSILLNCQIEANNRTEKAVIVAECYRRQGAWKFRFISQGFDGGLKPLSEHFGVEIADTPTPSGSPSSQSTSTPPAASNHFNSNNHNNNAASNSNTPTRANSSINLSKISLTKSQSSINLKKQDSFGKMSINLDWNKNPNKSEAPKKGLLKDLFASRSKGIDLDLGALVVLKNGNKELIQALGERFGHLQQSPYVKLRGDDRTGEVAGGEWLDINGDEWSRIEEIYIFAYIYSGVPNWGQTDGVVTLHVPQQPPIETRLTEGESNLGMCAIARLVNQNGSINVERINRYFKGHQEMDKAFGWGLKWRTATK